jgi:hypothetical protein
MKNIIIISLMFIFTTLYAGDLKKEFDTSAGSLLEMDIKTGGSIEISGWDKDKAEVTVYFRGSKLDEDINLEIKQFKKGVSVNASAYGNSNSDLRFEIKVPNKYDLDLKTMGGEIQVKDVEGELEGETMGGNIELDHLKGSARFKTMGGNIKVTDSDVDGKVNSMGGNIIFTDVAGNIDGSTMGGNVIYKNKNKSNKSGKNVKISTMGGNINIAEAMSGADVTTMGGNIDIAKAAEFVKASTMGGNIDINDIDGWVKASTMGGDIDVKMTGDPAKGERDVNISSMGGDIELVLPEGISAEFDVRITFTRKSNQDFKIESDFPLKIEEDKEWQYNDGDPHKDITGAGKTGNAKNLIKISTHNGDISIKKGK